MNITTAQHPQTTPPPQTPPPANTTPSLPTQPISPPLQKSGIAGGQAAILMVARLACIGMIAIGSLHILIPFITELTVRLRIQPERLTIYGTTYTPFSYFLLLDKKDSSVYPIEFLRIHPPSLVRNLPIRGNIPNVQEITVSNNPIEQLPDTIGELTDLEGLFITNGRLSSLPKSIGNLTKLKDLTLTGNRIKQLPDSIGNLTNLEALNLAYNDLDSLPPSVVQLTSVEFMDLTGNKFRTLPRYLPPNLKFLLIGNNPIPYNILRTATIPQGENIMY